MMISGGVKVQLQGAKNKTVVPLERANRAFLDQTSSALESFSIFNPLLVALYIVPYRLKESFVLYVPALLELRSKITRTRSRK